MRQDRKPEAGKQKHNHAEHRVWIFDRDTCSLVCFVLRCGPKGISRFSSCISASFWIGLFIYLFLRKVLAGVAKRFARRPRVTCVSRVLEQRSSRRWFAGEASAITKGNEGTKVVPQSDQIGIYIELPKVD